MKFQLKNIFLACALVACVSARAHAQVMPDAIFDNLPAAFGETLNDVPPDVTMVEISPKEPGASEEVTVRAAVSTDHILTVYRVERVVLTYEVLGVADPTDVEMKIADVDEGIWEATIPGQPSGAKVLYGISGFDGAGNAVVQLISDEGSSKDFREVLLDKPDKEIEASLDLWKVTFRADDKRLYYCQYFRRPFRWTTFRGAALTGLGFYVKDVRQIPAHSVTENTHSFIGYVPTMGIKAIISIDALMKGREDAGIRVPIKSTGRRLCGKAKIEDLTANPELGLKMFAVSAAYDFNGAGELNLSDSTPYALIYFKANRYTVK